MAHPIHLVSFAVSSVPASRKFYESLGWKVGKFSESDDCCFFQTGKVAVCIYDRASFQESLRTKNNDEDAKAVEKDDTEKKAAAEGDAAADEPASKRAKTDDTSDFIVPPVAVCFFTQTAEEVQEMHDKFVAAGARSIVKPKQTPWGTTTANVADPDNVLWEFMSREGLTFDSDGCIDMSL